MKNIKSIFTILALLFISANIEIISAQTPCQRIAIPAYFYPGAFWTQAIAAAPKVDFMIMNPDSGSGTSSNSDYVATIAQARNAGIKIYGYVYTNYGARSQTQITQEIDNYRNWYQVDGIFFDETSSQIADVPYYQTIANYVRTNFKGKVVLNPGVYPDESYMNVGDVVVVFENKLKPYFTIQVPAWTANYNADKFWHIVYNVPSWQIKNLINLSIQRRAGRIYFTDDRFINPYDTLPKFWDRLLPQIPQNCP